MNKRYQHPVLASAVLLCLLAPTLVVADPVPCAPASPESSGFQDVTLEDRANKADIPYLANGELVANIISVQKGDENAIIGRLSNGKYFRATVSGWSLLSERDLVRPEVRELPSLLNCSIERPLVWVANPNTLENNFQILLNNARLALFGHNNETAIVTLWDRSIPQDLIGDPVKGARFSLTLPGRNPPKCDDIHNAARRGRLTDVAAFVWHDSKDTAKRDAYGNLPLDYAVIGDYQSVAAFLIICSPASYDDILEALSRVTSDQMRQMLESAKFHKETAVHNIHDDDVLIQIVEHDDLGDEMRAAAVNQVTDQRMLSKVALQDRSNHVRLCAISRLSDPALLAKLATDKDASVRCSAVAGIQDQVLLLHIAIHDRNVNVRMASVAAMNDRPLLARVRSGTESMDRRLRQVALIREFLLDPVVSRTLGNVRVAATCEEEDRSYYLAYGTFDTASSPVP